MDAIKLRVWGDFACFTRPEAKAERLSYDVLTPSAARGMLEAIHWKPAITWVIDRIHVIRPIRFQSLRKSEVADKIAPKSAEQGWKEDDPRAIQYDVSEGKHRQQRSMQALRDVEYIIEAHVELTDRAGDDTIDKHYDMFCRRARKGQCFQRPFLGLREFAADFELIEDETPCSELQGETDLGLMLYDIDYSDGCTPQFFRARMSDGVIDVAAARQEGHFA